MNPLTQDERNLASYYLFNSEAERLPIETFHDPLARAVLETIVGMEAGKVPMTPTAFPSALAKRERLPAEPGVIAAEILSSEAESWTAGIAETARLRVKSAADRRELEHGLQVARARMDKGDPIEDILAALPHHSPPIARIPFLEILKRAARPGPEFLKMDIPERRLLVGDWFTESDLGFIFAPRGVGKTWFAHALIAALTCGRNFGPWEVPGRVPVALLDGEMPPDAVQERLQSLGADPAFLHVLHHQLLWDEGEATFQLGNPEQRKAILEYCRSTRRRLLVLDNLSSLSSVSENDNDEWLALGDWLLEFQRSGIAVLVVHHAGRNGNMRGASRREDRASFIVSLTDSRERSDTEAGARFTAKFTKARYARATPPTLDWHFRSGDDGKIEIETSAADLRTLVLECVRGGMDSASEIADLLEVSKGAVSKAAHRLEGEGMIRIAGRRYVAN